MLALHSSSGGVEEEEEENPGPGESSEGHRVLIPHGGEGMSPGDLHTHPHPRAVPRPARRWQGHTSQGTGGTR